MDEKVEMAAPAWTVEAVTLEIRTLQHQAKQMLLGYAIEVGRRLVVQDLEKLIAKERGFLGDRRRRGIAGVWEPGDHNARDEMRRLKERLDARDSLVDKLEDELYKLKEGKKDG